MNDRYSARRLHESTKHGTPPRHPDELVEFERLDPRNAPRPFKEYQGVDSLELPRQLATSEAPAAAVLSGMTGETRPLDLELLSTLLFLGAGVTRVIELPGRRVYFRTPMSAGNLHPVEVYVVVGDDAVDGLGAGLYHFSPLEFSLTPLRRGDYRGAVDVDTPAAVVLSGIPWRTSWKYAERGWRHLYWDAGTMLANFLTAADAYGVDHRTMLGFDDGTVAALLSIDGVSEMPLAIVTIGPENSREAPAGQSLTSLSMDVAPLAPSPFRLPLVEAAQAGSSLSADEVDSWRREGPTVARHASKEVESPDGPNEPIEDVILRRGSTREMVRRPVAPGHLTWPLAASTRAVGIDAIPEGSLLQHHVTVHSVEGLQPGAYRQNGGLELLRESDRAREESASLCLGQPLGGESAYTVFHSAELDPLFEALGSRGYRVAQLEAGVVSGRMALCAFALGLGATGLTFFDDAVARYFETTAQPMLVTSVGVPRNPSAPAGSPGEPVVLQR